jgi:hypothetical protein
MSQQTSLPAAKGYDGAFSLFTHALPIIARVILRLSCLATLKLALMIPFLRTPSYHPKAITVDFMTKVFRKKGILVEGERVASLRVEAMEMGAVGKVERIHITYADLKNESHPPETMVAKVLGTTIKDTIVGSLCPLSENEHRAYTHETFTRKVKGLQPSIYHFDMSFFGVGLLLMEDLRDLRHIKSRDGATLADLTCVVELCAKIHSRTLNQIPRPMVQEFQFHTYLLDHISGTNANMALTGPWGECMRAHPRLAQTMELFLDYDNSEKLFIKMRGFGFRPTDNATLPKPFACLIHGDVRLDNCFFDDVTKTAKLVDWQVIMPRAPLLDLGWLLMDGSNEALSVPAADVLRSLPVNAPPPKAEADACRAVVNKLLTAYLTTMSQELSQNTAYTGERPTMAYCQDMLPWLMLNDAFYMMVSVAQIFKCDPKKDMASPVVQTFLAYADRLEWLLRVFVPALDFIKQSTV